MKFYKEAKRLLDTDDVDINIPYVQGLGVMYVCSCMMGKDRAGWVYISQLAYAVGELAQKHKPPPESEEKEIIEHEHVMRHTQWGVFNLAA